MTCPVCGAQTRVYGSRTDAEGVYRRRRCLDPKCNYRFYTTEVQSTSLDFNTIEAARIRKYRKEKKL